MQKTLIYKVAFVIVISLVITAVINSVGNLVQERQARQGDAEADIAKVYSGAQRTGSPFIVIPYTEEFTENETDGKGNIVKALVKHNQRQLIYFPDNLSVKGDASTDSKHRGLFQVLVYEWQGDEHGEFNVPTELPLVREFANSALAVGTPYLVVPVSDARGLLRQPVASLAGQTLAFARSPENTPQIGSIAAFVPLNLIATGKPLAFQMQLGLRGTETFGFVPYGASTRFSLTSRWPTPSFGGAFLPSPVATEITAAGFSAAWEVSGLATSASGDMVHCFARSTCAGLGQEDAIETRFINPVNIYSLSDRATKYGFLFVGLIFAAFFIFELVNRLRIHPAQYLLIGLAISIFFLLLISVSEHLAFWISYACAATASTVLISAYLASVLKSTGRGVTFGIGMATLYACLYGLLISEDNALIMGSVFLFLILAGTMLLTRKVDWYDLQDNPLTV